MGLHECDSTPVLCHVAQVAIVDLCKLSSTLHDITQSCKEMNSKKMQVMNLVFSTGYQRCSCGHSFCSSNYSSSTTSQLTRSPNSFIAVVNPCLSACLLCSSTNFMWDSQISYRTSSSSLEYFLPCCAFQASHSELSGAAKAYAMRDTSIRSFIFKSPASARKKWWRLKVQIENSHATLMSFYDTVEHSLLPSIQQNGTETEVHKDQVAVILYIVSLEYTLY